MKAKTAFLIYISIICFMVGVVLFNGLCSKPIVEPSVGLTYLSYPSSHPIPNSYVEVHIISLDGKHKNFSNVLYISEMFFVDPNINGYSNAPLYFKQLWWAPTPEVWAQKEGTK